MALRAPNLSEEDRLRVRVLLNRKRWIRAAMAALVATLFVPPAAAELRTDGRLTVNLSAVPQIDGGWRRTATSNLGLTVEFFPGDRDNARAIASLSGQSRNDSSTDKPFSIMPDEMTVGASYLEVTTPLWAGGPQWLVRMGYQNVSWSPLIGSVTDRTGLTVSNVQFLGVTSRWIYLWGDGDDLATAGVQASARLGRSLLETTYVTRGGNSQLVIAGNALLLDNRVEARVEGSLDGVHLHEGSVSVSGSLVPNWGIGGAYGFSEGYRPLQSVGGPSGFMSHAQATVMTRQLGADWTVSHRVASNMMSETTVSARKHVAVAGLPIGLGYSATVRQATISHSFSGQTTLNLGPFQRVRLNGGARFGGGVPTWNVRAAYGVPDGLDFNVSYTSSGTSTLETSIGLSF